MKTRNCCLEDCIETWSVSKVGPCDREKLSKNWPLKSRWLSTLHDIIALHMLTVTLKLMYPGRKNASHYEEIVDQQAEEAEPSTKACSCFGVAGSRFLADICVANLAFVDVSFLLSKPCGLHLTQTILSLHIDFRMCLCTFGVQHAPRNSKCSGA